MTKLDGLHVYSILDDLAEAQLLDINSQIGSILHELHQVGFDSFGYVGTEGVVDPHQTNLEYMRFQFDKKVGEFLSLGGDKDLAERIRRYASEREPALATCLRPSFCHNDCHYGNVLVVQAGESWRVSGLVDFENVLSGDPLLDLAKTHCYAPRRSERTLAALAGGHGAVPDGWREAIDVYAVYHWIELWDWFASEGQTQWLDGIDTSLREVEGL